MTRHMTASALVMHPDGDKVLLGLHRAFKTWQFPGGHVEEGEAPHETAEREVLEETGVRVTIDRDGLWADWSRPTPIVVMEIGAPAKNGRPAHVHIDLLYLAHATTTAIAAADDINEVAWVPVRDIINGTAGVGPIRDDCVKVVSWHDEVAGHYRRCGWHTSAAYGTRSI